MNYKTLDIDKIENTPLLDYLFPKSRCSICGSESFFVARAFRFTICSDCLSKDPDLLSSKIQDTMEPSLLKHYQADEEETVWKNDEGTPFPVSFCTFCLGEGLNFNFIQKERRDTEKSLTFTESVRLYTVQEELEHFLHIAKVTENSRYRVNTSPNYQPRKKSKKPARFELNAHRVQGICQECRDILSHWFASSISGDVFTEKLQVLNIIRFRDFGLDYAEKHPETERRELEKQEKPWLQDWLNLVLDCGHIFHLNYWRFPFPLYPSQLQKEIDDFVGTYPDWSAFKEELSYSPSHQTICSLFNRIRDAHRIFYYTVFRQPELRERSFQDQINSFINEIQSVCNENDDDVSEFLAFLDDLEPFLVLLNPSDKGSVKQRYSFCQQGASGLFKKDTSSKNQLNMWKKLVLDFDNNSDKAVQSEANLQFNKRAEKLVDKYRYFVTIKPIGLKKLYNVLDSEEVFMHNHVIAMVKDVRDDKRERAQTNRIEKYWEWTETVFRNSTSQQMALEYLENVEPFIGNAKTPAYKKESQWFDKWKKTKPDQEFWKLVRYGKQVEKVEKDYYLVEEQLQQIRDLTIMLTRKPEVDEEVTRLVPQMMRDIITSPMELKIDPNSPSNYNEMNFLHQLATADISMPAKVARKDILFSRGKDQYEALQLLQCVRGTTSLCNEELNKEKRKRKEELYKLLSIDFLADSVAGTWIKMLTRDQEFIKECKNLQWQFIKLQLEIVNYLNDAPGEQHRTTLHRVNAEIRNVCQGELLPDLSEWENVVHCWLSDLPARILFSVIYDTVEERRLGRSDSSLHFMSLPGWYKPEIGEFSDYAQTLSEDEGVYEQIDFLDEQEQASMAEQADHEKTYSDMDTYANTEMGMDIDTFEREAALSDIERVRQRIEDIDIVNEKIADEKEKFIHFFMGESKAFPPKDEREKLIERHLVIPKVEEIQTTIQQMIERFEEDAKIAKVLEEVLVRIRLRNYLKVLTKEEEDFLIWCRRTDVRTTRLLSRFKELVGKPHNEEKIRKAEERIFRKLGKELEKHCLEDSLIDLLLKFVNNSQDWIETK